MHEGTLLAVGQPWPKDEFSIPSEGVSFGWHEGYLLVIGDPYCEINLERYVSSSLRLGFAEFGPLAVIAVAAEGIPASLDCARPFLPEDQPPEVTIDLADHLLWRAVLVQAGIVTNLRAFTTSPEVTVLLRRVAAAQRAHGPLTYAQADDWIRLWYREAPTEEVVWTLCSVQCESGA
jgi:hypothetical protein